MAALQCRMLCRLWLLVTVVTADRGCRHPEPEPERCDWQPEPAPAPYDEPAVRACARSCLQLRNQGGEHADGVYWFTGMPVPVMCDFSHDEGGWTLLVAAVSHYDWDALSVLGRAQRAPTLTDDYSILRHADAIRDLGTTGRFAYRLEAEAQVGRQRWGGVWLAPRSYSFVSETPAQSNVTLYRRFNKWKYSPIGIEQHMPWIVADDEFETLLTTTANVSAQGWGTFVTHKKHALNPVRVYAHSSWIGDKLADSGNTLYWMREEEA